MSSWRKTENIFYVLLAVYNHTINALSFDKNLNPESLNKRTALFLGYYAASSDNLLPKFRDKFSVPSSEVKNQGSWILDPLDKMERLFSKRR